MRILLIAPASGRWRLVGRRPVFSGRTFRFSLLSLLSVAGVTPPGHEIRLVDEQLDDVPWDEPWDLVGITCMTALAPRAYEIADRFRRRGVPVALGGFHPSLLPEEASAHADAVCAGDAEPIWPRIVEDARRGSLAGIYRAGDADAICAPRRLPRELLDPRRYGTVQAVQATRGCPNACSFCSIAALSKRRFRRRSVRDVVEEIATMPRRFVIFVDDSLTADRDYARELFHRLRPLGKHWVSQSTLQITDDDDLVELAAASGCVGLFVGLETFSEDSLGTSCKGFHRAREYRERVARLHAAGIGVEAGIVLGFDEDDRGVFARTLDHLDAIGIDAVQVSALTPLPGTALHSAMEPRIFDRDWAHYDLHRVVFDPARMSATELQAGHDWLTREFYSPRRIGQRLARVARRPRGRTVLPYATVINAAYWGRIRSWGIRGTAAPAQVPVRPARGLGSSKSQPAW